MASSSSSSTTAGVYDVFLNFRGETRKSFSNYLYEELCQAGINTFRDDEEIRKGENISVELLKAIEGSKISIIVFSKTYAQSRWCLDELVKILDCKKNLQQMVLPIFYNVDPSEVRKQTGEFGKALAQHRQQFDDQRVDGWKVALTGVADLSGWDLQTMTNGYESKLIKKITKEVLREVNHNSYMNVAKYPVGIESRVRDILHLLQTQRHDGIKMFGIFGMGGVGKTTLAKAIYNLSFQKFEGCCFIANIRSQVSEGHHGLVRLQEKLLCKTLNRKKLEIDNVDKGISLIKERLRSKIVLIVLDDIDNTTQLESLAGQRNWFGPGSTIIITTRDVQLLSDMEEHEKYNVETLSLDESLQLLSWHAFGVPIPLEEYIELSKRIASYTCGLPVALTIIGSHLRGKSVQEWSDDAEKLRGIPHDDVQKILKISYDSLDDDTRNIFLDIAYFFIGHNKNDTSMILEACGFYAKSGIRILIERCLLTTTGGGTFETLQMHDLVRDMGREIVRKESPREPSKQSRLIDPKDVFDVIHENKGTEAIEGMIVNSNILKNVSLNTQVFKRMVKLRILILNGLRLSGSFKYLSNELRLFRLHNCHLSCIPSNLCCEKLVEFDMKRSNIKEFQFNMEHFRCLRILNLDYCEQLKKTPNFTGVHALQKVSFVCCLNLTKVHPSIGSLERLIELDFENCKKLKVLPSSICKLKSLEVLRLDECEKLGKLPIDLGKLEHLRDLLARRTAISHIPFSLGCLRNLRTLYLGEYRSSILSKSKSPLFLLRRSCYDVGFFTPSVANLWSLEVIENLTSLVYLNLSERSYLQSLPFGLCHLSNLKFLWLDNLQNLRVLVELPPNLEGLSAKNCVSLEKIVAVSNLKRLKVLCLENCKSLVELPNMEGHASLVELDIRNCNEVDLKNWFIGLCHLINLKFLSLDNLQNLRVLGELPPSLKILSAKNCVSLEKIADISNLKRLVVLCLKNCKSLVELPNMESLSCLEMLDIRNCKLEKIADLSNLKRLKWLGIHNCKSLFELSGLESLSSLLGSLGIANCSDLRIPSIEKWFKARSKSDSIEIVVRVRFGGLSCYFPLTTEFFEIKHNVIDPCTEIDYDDHGRNRIGLSVRSKSSGAWILKEPKYINIEANGYDLIPFEVPTMMGEVLEVYVEVHPLQKIICVFEIHRNREGEVSFFPSARGCIDQSNYT